MLHSARFYSSPSALWTGTGHSINCGSGNAKNSSLKCWNAVLVWSVERVTFSRWLQCLTAPVRVPLACVCFCLLFVTLVTLRRFCSYAWPFEGLRLWLLIFVVWIRLPCTGTAGAHAFPSAHDHMDHPCSPLAWSRLCCCSLACGLPRWSGLCACLNVRLCLLHRHVFWPQSWFFFHVTNTFSCMFRPLQRLVVVHFFKTQIFAGT
jgi:hypothetical protein